ncbi:free fatty acid receptor 4-like [Tubulanus polymorphus]|uniref:free fatty acid receptor 4-like n=1 Tax=Tubulanus polymorphus TaxID=672921 RepID=UPI003DA5B095
MRTYGNFSQVEETLYRYFAAIFKSLLKFSPILSLQMSPRGEFNKSYFMALEEGFNRTYFTFYSEFNRQYHHVKWVEVFFLCGLCLWSVVGNSLLITVVLRCKPLRTVMNFFVINLAASDMCFTIVGPIIAIARVKETWIMGTFMCSLIAYGQTLCGVVSMWMMTLVSIDRHRYICGTGRNNITTKSAKLMIFLTWVIAAAAFIPLALFFHVKQFPFGTSSVTICTLMWPTKEIKMSCIFVLIVCILGFIVPLIVIIFNYVQIFKKFSSKREETALRRLSSSAEPPAVQESDDKDTEEDQVSRDAKDYQLVRMTAMVVGTFIVMWTPLCIIFLVVLFDGYGYNGGRMAIKSWSFIFAICLAFTNSCMNPVIYFTFNQKFRSGLKMSWHSFSKPTDDNGVAFESLPVASPPHKNGRIGEENLNDAPGGEENLNDAPGNRQIEESDNSNIETRS